MEPLLYHLAVKIDYDIKHVTELYRSPYFASAFVCIYIHTFMLLCFLMHHQLINKDSQSCEYDNNY